MGLGGRYCTMRGMPASGRDRVFPGVCSRQTLAGSAAALKISFLAPPRTHTGGHARSVVCSPNFGPWSLILGIGNVRNARYS